MFQPARFVLTTLVLSVALLPVMAFAVEVEGVVVDAPPVEDVRTEVAIDHAAAWDAHLRGQRAARIADLRAYAEAGVFPQKPGEAGFHHQFLDAEGRPCAVASLIMTSGRPELVRQMAQVNNGVVVSELEGGPIVEWVLASGLTMEEIAVIQVPGWNSDRVIAQPVLPEQPVRLTRAERKERARVQRHLEATIALLEADTEASIWKAMTRVDTSGPPVAQFLAAR